MDASGDILLEEATRRAPSRVAFLSWGGEILHFGRSFFAVAVAWVLWLDEPDQRGSAEFWVPLAFAVLSLGLAAVWSLRPPNTRLPVTLHYCDLTFALTLLVIGEKSVLLFVMWSTFCLLSAASQWHWKAVAVTGAVLTTIYLACVTLGLVGTERLLIRSGYLVGATLLITTGTFRRDRSRAKLLKLAAWASGRFEETPDALRSVFRHACNVLDARQVVVVWRETGVGAWHCAHYDLADDALKERASSHGGESSLPEAIRGRPYLWTSARPDVCLTLEGRVRAAGAIPPHLLDHVNVRAAICTIPFAGQICEGRLFAIDVNQWRWEHLVYGELATAHVLTRLEGTAIRQQRSLSAVEQERARWSRDLHDGLLQNMTAIRLQLRAAVGAPGAEAIKQQVTKASDLLREEQERLRVIVEASRPSTGNKSVPLRRLAETIEDIAGHWQVEADVEAEPLHAVIPHVMFRELALVVSEAVANAARHEPGGRFKAMISLQRRILQLTFINATTRATPPLGISAPRSMTERVIDLGGTLSFEVESGQVILAIEVPIRD